MHSYDLLLRATGITSELIRMDYAQDQPRDTNPTNKQQAFHFRNTAANA